VPDADDGTVVEAAERELVPAPEHNARSPFGGVVAQLASLNVVVLVAGLVTGPLTATYAAPPTATAAAAKPFTLTVRVANLGRAPWGHAAQVHAIGAAELEPARRAKLVARWVDLGGAATLGASPAGAGGSAILPAGLAPGAAVNVELLLTAPAAPGEYLLVLDVIDPATGSLAAAGVPPGIIRVTVTG
jgi:hypothetical protein